MQTMQIIDMENGEITNPVEMDMSELSACFRLTAELTSDEWVAIVKALTGRLEAIHGLCAGDIARAIPNNREKK